MANSARCAACGGASQIDVHHLTYQHLGAERDSELVALCRGCHDQAHYIAKSKGVSVARATWLILPRNSIKNGYTDNRGKGTRLKGKIH